MARYVDLDKIIDHLHDEWGYEGMREELYDDLQIPVENVIAWTPIRKELPPIGVPLLVTVDRRIAEGPPKAVLGPVYRMQETMAGEIGYFEYANFERRIGPDYFQVVAWMEWPAPWEESV